MALRGKDSVGVVFWGVVVVLCAATAFHGCSAALFKKKSSGSGNGGGSSVVFQLRGNVYPVGYYYAEVYIGNPPKPYYLDIDSGSDLTWLQCDAPCVSCPQVPHPLYKLTRNALVVCTEAMCKSFHSPPAYRCDKPTDQCDYEVEYADNGSSLGILVRDIVPIRYSNGTVLGPRLAFGCGYDQHVSKGDVSPTDGVLGLGNGKSTIASQLRSLGLIQNVIGHCMSARGGGYLFFGNELVPSSGIAVYRVKSLPVIFDSGSSYTYFNRQAYQVFLSLVKKGLAGKPLNVAADKTLSICWKGAKPFRSVLDVKQYFTPVTLSFANKKSQLEIPPENYLIISSLGNVCLGILNGTEIGLENMNLIGDVSLQNQLVIYDNEKQRIGWIRADCNRLPNVDRDDDFFQPYAAKMGILTDYCPATDTYDENER
ncbi:hypothetical protein Scep_002682 [Stephania cephalantha]|uniref:Peptidase A1 domain-containing protein n=1 Tax=Stephania cephalantha TaxID=152367 RepID=A0AAP0LAN7_9MAGN